MLGTLLAAVLPLLGPLCGECATLLAGQVTLTILSIISCIYNIYIQVSLTQGVLTGLSRIARSGPVVMDWQVAANSSEIHVQLLTAGRSSQAGDGSQGGGPHCSLQRRRLRPRHEPQPRHQHPRAARRRGLRLPGVAKGLNRFFSVERYMCFQQGENLVGKN